MQHEKKDKSYNSYKNYLADTTNYKNSISESETAKEPQIRNHRQFYVHITSDTLFTDLVERIHLFENIGDFECNNLTIFNDFEIKKQQKTLSETEIYLYLASLGINNTPK